MAPSEQARPTTGPRVRRMALALLALLAGTGSFLVSAVLATAPAGASVPDPLTWASPVKVGTGYVNGVSCPSSTFCVAVTAGGAVLTSTDPTGGVAAWTETTGVDANDLTGVSCPTTTLCVATDVLGQVFTSTDPAGGAGDWTAADVDGTDILYGVSCPTTALCVVVGYQGAVVTSTDPTGGASQWTTATLAVNSIGSVSCPTTTFCVATDDHGDVIPSTDPTGGTTDWTVTKIDGIVPISSISCPTTTFCAATDVDGYAPISTDPTGGTSSWPLTDIDNFNDNSLEAVSCASASSCTMVDNSGLAFSSVDPTQFNEWNESRIDNSYLERSVACPSTVLCVVSDADGDVVTGTGVPPAVTAVIPSAGTTAGGTPVTIGGTGFTGATEVDFGGAPCTSVTVIFPTELTCDTPAEAAATVDVRVTAPGGQSAVVAADQYTFTPPSNPNPYHPLPPARICDTRTGGTRVGCATGATLAAGAESLVVQAEGNGGIPDSGVTAVVVNVTVTDTSASSHLTLYPDGESEPTASNLNWTAGQTDPNLVTVGLSGTGAFDATNFGGSADVIIDVEGYYAPGDAGAGLYNALATPARICDTRSGNPSGLSGTALTQCEGQAPTPGDVLAVQVDGQGGVPASGVGAVVLNVTAVGASSRGYLTAFPAGGTAPLASNVNYGPGISVPNRVIVPVSAAGAVDILSFAGTPQILVDVAGWFTDDSSSSAPGTHFSFASAPTRVCDTRTGVGYTTPCTGHTLAAGVPLAVTVDGVGGIPSGVTAVVLNVTVTGTTSLSHLTVYPAGQSLPTVSDLNWQAGRTVPNLTVATVGTGGQIEVDNYAGGADVVVDVIGWFS